MPIARALITTAAIGVVVLAVPGSTAIAHGSSSEAGSGGRDDGLEQRFSSAGLCDGGPRYRAIFRNADGGDDYVRAEVTVRGAGPRERWYLATEATTIFADDTGVTGNSDGFARSSARGVISASAATPFGVRHSIEFLLGRRQSSDFCRIRVAG